jgi:hypothetical protein
MSFFLHCLFMLFLLSTSTFFFVRSITYAIKHNSKFHLHLSNVTKTGEKKEKKSKQLIIVPFLWNIIAKSNRISFNSNSLKTFLNGHSSTRLVHT